MISAIVLAAGLARRFGSAKPLALYEAKPLVRHVVDRLAVADVTDVIVVVPRPAAAYASALAGTRARTVVNEAPADGMSSSLHVGLSALDPWTQAVLVALADQPMIEPDVLVSMIREWRASRSPIVAPVYRGERGHPVLFAAAVFPELRAVSGDRGARDVIERDQRRVRLMAIDRDLPRDIDTPEDLAALNDLAR
ncbi:MAG: nucleotidyltransferase family protein [Gemmatimonadaceae bacterium]